MSEQGHTAYESDPPPNVIIVFTADHGDYMGDHRMIRKGPHVYESLVHVPLMMRWGDRFASRSTDALACNVDIFPTLCDLCGIEETEGVPGKSLLPVLRGNSDSVQEYLFFEHGNPGEPVQPGDLTPQEYAELEEDTGHHLCGTISRGCTRGVRWEDWKYIYNHGEVDELYNLAEDPAYSGMAREGRDRLLAWEVESEDALPASPEC